MRANFLLSIISKLRSNTLSKLVLFTTIILFALFGVGVILRYFPVVSRDDNESLTLIPEETEYEILKAGICPRCNSGIIEAVCSHEYYQKDGSIYVLEECDNPMHPEGCERKITYCFTNYAHVNCPAEYFNSGTETHLESVEHTLVESSYIKVCKLPICIPKWMEDSHK